MAEVHGHCDPRFSTLKTLLSSNIASGVDIGASICVNLDGEDVVDIWAGHTDSNRSTPWSKDTIVNVWSTTKTVTSLAAFILVERGQLDLEENVATYWPEFGANGKENVKVKHILSHTSGVSGFEEKVSFEDICDHEKSIGLLEKQRLWWEPGTKSGYHAMTMGHLVGEVVRRITGKPLKQFVAEEIAGPLGADFQIGAKEEDWDRIATLIPPPPPPKRKISRDSVLFKTMGNPVLDARRALTPLWRGADMGGANGHGNARSVVRMLSPMSLGGKVKGLDKPLLSPETINLVFNEQAYGQDLVIGEEGPLRWGTGFALGGPDTIHAWLPQGRVFFWCGWGGSVITMDLDRKLTISYTMNKMELGTLGGPRTHAYVLAVYRALGVPLPGEIPAAKL